MTDKATESNANPQPLGLGLGEGLGPLVEVLATWEDQNGAMCAILPSEWDALKQDVMDACVLQSPRMLRTEMQGLLAKVAELEATEEGAKTAFAHVVDSKRDLERENAKLRGLLDDARAQIRRQSALVSSRA